MNDLPKISILIPTYNRRNFIPFVLRNLLIQEYPHKLLQVVIHDDGETPLIENYEDFRYPLNIIDLKTFNMEKVEFENDKKENKLINSLNKVPFLEVDGVTIPQSKAIERYLATRGNMMGDSPLEYARIDSICECIRDFKDAYQKVRNDKDKECKYLTKNHKFIEWQ